MLAGARWAAGMADWRDGDAAVLPVEDLSVFLFFFLSLFQPGRFPPF